MQRHPQQNKLQKQSRAKITFFDSSSSLSSHHRVSCRRKFLSIDAWPNSPLGRSVGRLGRRRKAAVLNCVCARARNIIGKSSGSGLNVLDRMDGNRNNCEDDHFELLVFAVGQPFSPDSPVLLNVYGTKTASKYCTAPVWYFGGAPCVK